MQPAADLETSSDSTPAGSAESLGKGSIVHGRETDAYEAAESVDADDDVDEIPPYRQPQPPRYKPGTRLLAATVESTAPAPPWWASTDPKVWADGQQGAIVRGRRIKTNGTSSA